MKQKRQKLLVISSYPSKGQIHGEKVVGVASYAKNTLYSLASQYKTIDITVLAEKLEDEEDYREKRISVRRVWTRNSFSAFPNLLREIFKKHKDTKNILIEFELAMFGDILFLLPFPILLLFLTLAGKEITIVMHQVIADINELHGHINISNKSSKASAMNFMMRTFYRILFLFSKKIIVFEEVLKDDLQPFGNKKDVVVIPHGVETIKKIPKLIARKKLRLKKKQFVALSFGFIAWYKGTDLLIHAFRKYISNNKRNAHYKLIIAGGPNPNHLDKEFYIRYVKSITKESRAHGIRLTGFVPEKEIPFYYVSSDVIVFSYRTFMSASGPLSIAFACKKPFLISNSLKDLLKTHDIKEALSLTTLTPEDLIFSDGITLRKQLMRIEKNATLRKKMVEFSTKIAKMRSWKHIATAYYEQIFE